MKITELLEALNKFAKTYAPQAIDSIKRNSHMNNITQDEPISNKVTDAILVDFINYIGMQHGIDYGLYTQDLRS